MESKGRLSRYSQFQDEDVKLRGSIVQSDGSDEGGMLQAAQQEVLTLGGWTLLPRAPYELHRHLHPVTVPLTPFHHTVNRHQK